MSIENEIAALEHRLSVLRNKRETSQKEKWQDDFGVMVLCRRCYGDGVTPNGGDFLDLDWDTCDACHGRGWLFAVRYDNNIPDDIEEIVDSIDERDNDYTV